MYCYHCDKSFANKNVTHHMSTKMHKELCDDEIQVPDCIYCNEKLTRSTEYNHMHTAHKEEMKVKVKCVSCNSEYPEYIQSRHELICQKLQEYKKKIRARNENYSKYYYQNNEKRREYLKNYCREHYRLAVKSS
jgi:hypothetical protein